MLQSVRVYMLILGILICCSSIPVHGAVAVTPGETWLSTDASTGDCQLTISNSSDQPEQCEIKLFNPVTVKATGPSSGTLTDNLLSGVEAKPATFTLDPYGKQVVTVSLSPNVKFRAGTYPLQVKVNSITTRQLLASAAMNVRISPMVQGQLISAVYKADDEGHGIYRASMRFLLDTNARKLRLNADVSQNCILALQDGTELCIPIDTSRGLEILFTGVDMPAGTKTIANYVGEVPGAANGLRATESLVFESDQLAVATREVMITAWWRLKDPLQFAGRYQGRINLTASVEPN